ncbi:MAG TPA: amino acid adenylation domain-containing protein [Terriglobales bacterium]|nr:amino acid adenylation domain-containing protein [Terriglobales bacterium]
MAVISQIEKELVESPYSNGEQAAGVFSGDVFAMPASPAQEKFWAFEHAYPASRVWNVAARWSLRGPLKPEVLSNAINQVCARHEALRTCLDLQSGAVIQKVASELKLSLPLHDLRHLSESDREMEAERITLAEATRPFDLSRGPLIRTRLIQLENEHYVLLVTVHHAIVDGWSVGIISRDLGAYYQAVLTGASAKLAPLPVQFADFTVWQKEAFENGLFESQLAYWRKQLRGLDPLVISGDIPEPAEPTWNGKIVSELLPRSLTDALGQVSQHSGTTMFSAALGALCILLNGLSGREDIAIGTQVAGRNRVEVENAIGVFNNALVLRTKVPGTYKFSDWLNQVSDTVIQATSHQEVPHERVLQAMGHEDLGRDRLYYVNFIYQRSFIENIKFADIQLTDLPSRTPGAPYDLNFFMVERPEGWRLSLEYSTDLYSPNLAQSFLTNFRTLLQEVVANPDRQLNQFETTRSMKAASMPAREHLAKQVLKTKASSNGNGSHSKADMIVPASLAQQRFWVLEQLGEGSGAFNIPIRWLLKGHIQTDVLERTFNELIRRHEILRTTLTQIDGQPMQRIVPALNIQLPVIDLSGLPEAKRSEEADRVTRKLGEEAFDLSRLPLIRASILAMQDHEYILHVTVHHIVADGWSVGLLAQEIGDIYNAFVKGLSSPLPEPEMQYSDYAAWQRALLQSEEIREQNQYWRERFHNHTPFEVMPDKPRPALQTTNGDVVSIQLSRHITDMIQEVSRKQGNTFFITACATFLTLLYRYTGQEDITIGTQVSGRNQVEHEKIIGLFLNTLPLRNDLSGNPTFSQLLERLQEVVMQALAHQDTPFEQLVEMINPKRDLSRNPLFQVNFMLQRSLVTSRDYETFSLIDVPSRLAGAMYDLNCLMVERPDGWRASIQFNTDLFETETASRMLSHFERLLEEVGKNPGKRISEFALLTAGESNLLKKWNGNTLQLPQEKTVHQLIQTQIERTPKAIAVICGRENCSYEELDRRSNQLARYIEKLGVRPGAKIALCLERSVNMMVALLAIMKAGASYIPLDPAYPAERLTYMIEDSGVSLLLTQQKLLPIIPANAVHTICLDIETKKIGQESPEKPGIKVDSESLAYVIYTSGSTGKPKGVQIPHRAVVNLLLSMQQEPGIHAQDVLVAVTTLSFDIAALELFLPLTVGARLVIASREQASVGTDLFELVKRERATILQATPSTWQILLDAGWRGDPSLKMLCGGEALPRSLANQLLAAGEDLWNMYGPTETTIWSSTLKVKAGSGPVPIGPPIANTQFYVLDKHFQQAPLGTPGELYIGGTGVAHGYLNRPELTREKFIPDPFSDRDDALLYRTGDLVRWKIDGEIEFLGRTDHQVKVRGFRIETGEIETVIGKHPSVKEAAVVARDDQKGSKYLVAYLVLDSADTSSAATPLQDLRSHLQQTLPEYMQPSAFVTLDALPRTPNGKIDRNALPAPDLAEVAKASYLAPANEIEQRMLLLWEKLLGISKISTTANFFDIGGHSLLAAQLLAKIEKAFGKKLPLATLFQAPTIQQLSAVIAGKTSSQAIPGLVALQASGSNTPIFCLHGVPSMRLLSQELGTNQPFYLVNLPEDAKVTAPYRIEDIAAIHLKTIQAVQPHGPYTLVGWCREALLAYEIAQQLQARGEKVALVGMFDTWVPGYLSRFSAQDAIKARKSFESARLGVHFENIRNASFLEGLDYIWDQSSTIIVDRIRYARVALAGKFGVGVGSQYAGTRQSQDDLLLIAVKQYQPKVFDGPVILFRSDKYRTWKYWDAALGWKHLIPNLIVHEVPGVHDSMLTGPNLPSIAQAIAKAVRHSAKLADRAVV